MTVLLFIRILYLLLMRNKWMITLHNSCCKGFIYRISLLGVWTQVPQSGPGEKPGSKGCEAYLLMNAQILMFCTEEQN